MKKIIFSFIATMLMVGVLTACSNRDVGMVGGGVLGGVAGSALTGGSTAGTIVGAVGGGYVGRQLAH
jgi:osmotically inducible lipoprotein OsmB